MCKSYDIIWTENMFYYIIISQVNYNDKKKPVYYYISRQIFWKINVIFIYRCHTSSGKCDCPAGWTGIYCDTPCPIGTYGQDCQEKCTCENGATCNHVTGKFEYLVLLLYVIYFFNGFFANCNKSAIIV